MFPSLSRNQAADARCLARVVVPDPGDPVDGLEPGHVHLLEHHAAALQRRDGGLEVVDAPPHLCERARRCAGGREQGELAFPAWIQETALALLARFEAEFL